MQKFEKIGKLGPSLFFFAVLATSIGATSSAAPQNPASANDSRAPASVSHPEKNSLLRRPRLVTVIVIDQFRADYLTRFQSKFLPAIQKSGELGGFAYLMNHSAYFPQGQHSLLQNMTAPGHATVLTGSYAYQNGISLNEWYDRDLKKEVYCADDASSPVLSSHGPLSAGLSPKNLNATTVGDELKNAEIPSRTITVALKDRSAIFLGGHQADLALWVDKKSGEWVSSKHYFPNGILPEWIKPWNEHLKATSPIDEKKAASPFGVDFTMLTVEKLVDEYQIGQTDKVDLFGISFSSHDMVGHRYGPNSPQAEEITLAEDKALSRLFNLLRRKVPGGLKDVVFVLTADHGAPASPEWAAAHKLSAGRLEEAAFAKSINDTFNKKYGKPKTGEWVEFVSNFNFTLNRSAIAEEKLSKATLEAEAKAILLANPNVAHVLTSSEYHERKLPPGMFQTQVMRSFYPKRNGDLILMPMPFYIPSFGDNKPGSTTHITSYSYDRTVPILFSGMNIKSGIYPVQVEVVDIAPTLSFLLGTIPPSMSEGRILSEAIQQGK